MKRPVAVVVAAIAVPGAVVLAFFGAQNWRTFQAERAYERGITLRASGQADAARQALREARAMHVRHRAARFALGELELEAGRMEHAFLEFQTLVELNPHDAAAWHALARTWEQAAMWNSAEEAASRALAADPDRAEACLLRAQVRQRLGKHWSSRHDARQVLALQPDSTGAREAVRAAEERIATGRIPGPAAAAELPGERFWPPELARRVGEAVRLMQSQAWDQAAALARTAEADYPGTMIGPWLAGVASYAQGRFEMAEQHLVRALTLAPRSSRVATHLAGAWAKQHGPQVAGDRLVELAQRDPGFVVPLDIAASAYLEARLPASAKEALRKGRVLAPDVPDAHRYLAAHLLQMDRPHDAVTVCDAADPGFPADAALQRLCAQARLDAEDRAGAITAYARIASADPGEHTAVAALARLLAESGDPASRERAHALAWQLANDAPADPQVIDAVGWVLLDDDPKAARGWLEVAAARAPDDPPIRYHLGVACARLGDRGCARRELQAALASPEPFRERPEVQRLLTEVGG